MQQARVQISANFLRDEADHRRLAQIVAKAAVMRAQAVLQELDNQRAELLLAAQRLMEAQFGESKEGEPGYNEYEEFVVYRDSDTCVVYFDQEPERGPWGWRSSNSAAHVLIACDRLVDDIPTRHYLVVAWDTEGQRWAPVYPWPDKNDDVPEPGHVFAVVDETSQGMLLSVPRIHEVIDLLVGANR